VLICFLGLSITLLNSSSKACLIFLISFICLFLSSLNSFTFLFVSSLSSFSYFFAFSLNSFSCLFISFLISLTCFYMPSFISLVNLIVILLSFIPFTIHQILCCVSVDLLRSHSPLPFHISYASILRFAHL
jgi:hypothetical protein